MEASKKLIIEEFVAQMGYRVAYITNSFGNKKIIIVAVENKDYSPMTISEIEKLHKNLVTKLYVENVVDENTSIEVGSPGLDRLLVVADDFSRYIGSKIKVSLKFEVDGRKKFQAIILGVTEKSLQLELLDKNNIEISIDDINQASIIPEISFAKKDKR
jgi:ribosome maturation factor RimP